MSRLLNYIRDVLQNKVRKSMTSWDDRQWAKLDQALEKLEVAWKTSPEPELAQFLPCLPDDPEFPIILARLIAVDRECRRKAGRPKSFHEYIAEWPILRDNPDLLSEKETDAFITDPTSEKLGSTVRP